MRDQLRENLSSWLQGVLTEEEAKQWRTVRGTHVQIDPGEDISAAFARHKAGGAARVATQETLGADYLHKHSLMYQGKDAAKASRYAPIPEELEADKAKGDSRPAIKQAVDLGHINYRTAETYGNAVSNGWLDHHEVHQRLRAHRVLSKASAIADSLKEDPVSGNNMARYYGMHLRQGSLNPMKVRAVAQQSLELHYRDHPKASTSPKPAAPQEHAHNMALWTSTALTEANRNGQEGSWVTMRGSHVFVKKGQSPASALKAMLAHAEQRAEGKTAKANLPKQLADSGGFTIQPRYGIQPKKGCVFSPYPEREVQIHADTLSDEHIDAFIRSNWGLLQKRDHYFGGWANEGTIYLDVSVVANSHDEAKRASVKYKQLAYYDLESGATVTVAETPRSTRSKQKGEEGGQETQSPGPPKEQPG